MFMLLETKIMLLLQLRFCGLVEPEPPAIELMDDNWTHGIITYTSE